MGDRSSCIRSQEKSSIAKTPACRPTFVAEYCGGACSRLLVRLRQRSKGSLGSPTEGAILGFQALSAEKFRKPTVCPSHDSMTMLSCQWLPMSIQWWRGHGQEAKRGSVGIASRGLGSAEGCVANFAQEVVKGQLPLSVGD